MIIAKESSAPRRADEYTSYLHLLTANGNDLTELVRSALGDSTATRFEHIWSAQNDHLVKYTIGLVTHNQSKSEGAMSGLVSTFVPQFSLFINDVTQIPPDLITQLLTKHVVEIKAMLDDQFAQNYPRLYADIRVVYAHAAQVGDALAPRITQMYPDKFPGNASSPAVDLRVSMNMLLQEHLYLATMSTSAAAGGRVTEKAAAAGALTANAKALDALFTDLFGELVGARFHELWTATNAAMIGYASASAGAPKQRALGQLNVAFVTQLSAWVQDSTGLVTGASLPMLEAQVEAVITVIDDQRSKSSARLAADDRSADASTAVVADLIASAAVAKLHTRFGA
jgi:hypothetical protein